MNIDDDNALWSKTKDPRDNAYKSDFYDEWSKKQLWPSSFAESYNRDIDFDEAKKKEYYLDKEFFSQTVKDSIINPKHYKNVAAGKQYMELMVDMLANKSGVEAHLFGQVYKYLMRCGNKDDEVQELEKALWYLNALIKYKKEGIVL
jgi:hypothetical protein